jgi:hypothetical protein
MKSLATTTPRLLAGPIVTPIINGDVVRLLKLPTGGWRIEHWIKGAGWSEAPDGAFDLGDFMPGYTRPISPRDRARLGMPPLYDTSAGEKLVHLFKERAFDLAVRQVPPGRA